ncbi:3-dehydroquinate dehydratase [Ephemeroptericola cinctiostellae]|uniref:3-dehydroquinate dehydratase n=2 Tax=Ephemeroptericola cinctiostellae TaxID=2268024 RepID=A0A345D9Y3_9BURK|nr:type II 3-dehydroquinate dehydratase [Ephemeroptericola cinctiostellae]AXF85171.1 3-dehydroquinate dehydratase [Ephemeroptericola cinctiostellae]
MAGMQNVLVINGPNLNLLGTREPAVYGSETLADVVSHLVAVGQTLNINVSHVQNNIEGELVNAIHAARGQVDAIIINAGAYTHTSVALRDALAGVEIPFVEVHISNVHKREAFRHHSYLSDAAIGVIVGLGSYGYEAALRFLAQKK